VVAARAPGRDAPRVAAVAADRDDVERLNPELCTEILFYKIRELIPKVPLLRTAGKRFPEILATAMDPQVFIEGDAVFIESEHGQMMYFIDKGLAEILVSAVGNEVVRLIADGCFFGEAACILKCRRTATIRCKLCGNQIFNPTSMCTYATVSTRGLLLCFENSTRAIDSSKNQPNRLRFDRAREF
jgi:hypothetical protein